MTTMDQLAAPVTSMPPGSNGAHLGTDHAQASVALEPAHVDPALESRRDLIRVIVLEDLPQVAEKLNEMLKGHARVQLVETIADGGTILDRIRQLRPDVLIIDALLRGPENGVQVANRLRALGIAVPIIMLTVPKMPLVLGKGMQATDVLTMPIAPGALAGAIVALDEAHRGPAPARLTGVQVLYSVTGGVGRSTIAVNLAVSIQHSQGSRVALVDGDLQSGDIRFVLDAPPSAPSIVDLPTDRITESDLRQVMWQSPLGIDVLLAPRRIEEAELVSARDVRRSLAVLNEVYDAVIVDTSTSLNDVLLTFMDAAERVVYVVTDEILSRWQAIRCRDALLAAGFATDKLCFLANKAGSSHVEPSNGSSGLDLSITASVPFEPMLAAGMDSHVPPIVVAQPQAPVSRAIIDLPTRIAAPPA